MVQRETAFRFIEVIPPAVMALTAVVSAVVSWGHWSWFKENPGAWVVGGIFLLALLALSVAYFYSREPSLTHLRPRLLHGMAISSLALTSLGLIYVVSMPSQFPDDFIPDTTVKLTGSSTLGEYLMPQYVQAVLARNHPATITMTTTTPSSVTPECSSGVCIKIDADFNSVPPEKRPDPEFRGLTKVRFIINAQGSAAGFAALGNGSSDLNMVSGGYEPKDAKKFSPSPSIGKDAIAIIVNSKNSLKEIDKEIDYAKLQAIFRGEGQGNWKVFYRQGRTTDDLETYLYGKDATHIQGKEVSSNIDMLNEVAQEQEAIGYVSSSFLDRNPGVQAVGIKRDGKPYDAPSVESIRLGKYDLKLTREIYLYERDPSLTSQDQKAQAIAGLLWKTITLDYGQNFVRSAGFFIPSDNCRQSDGCGRLIGGATRGATVPSYNNYRQQPAIQTIRFATNDNISGNDQLQTLDEWIQGLSDTDRGKTLILFGHSNVVGNPTYNRGLSLERAEWVQKKLEERHLSVSYISGLGSQYPAPAGGNSRRVEIYFQ